MQAYQEGACLYWVVVQYSRAATGELLGMRAGGMQKAAVQHTASAASGDTPRSLL